VKIKSIKYQCKRVNLIARHMQDGKTLCGTTFATLMEPVKFWKFCLQFVIRFDFVSVLQHFLFSWIKNCLLGKSFRE